VSDGVLGGYNGGDAGAIDDGSVIRPGDGNSVTGGSCLTSPVVTVGKHETCTGRLAAAKFSNALCSCRNLHVGDSFTTRGFDSALGPYQADQSDNGGASVGGNGSYTSVAGTTDIGGSFSLADSSSLQLLGALLVDADFYAGGNVSVVGNTAVGRDAWLAGSFAGVGSLKVGRALHYTGSVVALLPTYETIQQQTVTIAKPCPCENSDILNIPALVDAAKSKNDNNKFGIDKDALASIAATAQLTIPCGQFYLSQIAGLGNITVHVTGMSALFIDGSIDVTGNVSFTVDPGAEIDVFVKQDLLVQGSIAIASKDRPAAGRIWVGGSQPINLLSPWIGNLYAPQASVSATIALEVWGSIFASDFSAGAVASFIFDRSVLFSGDNCTAPRPPAGVCTQCQWCWGGSACMSGVCGACRSDSDCCSLSICDNGKCVPSSNPSAG
jgi:hypothetical protein